MASITDLDYVLMAGRAYQSTRDNKNNWFPVPNNWKEIVESHQDLDNSGFEAVAYVRGTPTIENQGKDCEFVISYAGTGPGLVILQPDWWANYDLATGSCCDQLRQAAVYYLMIKQQYQQYPKATITLTGQSLGGGLASLIGVFFNVKAVTFDQAPFSNSATVAIREDLIDFLTTPQGGNTALYSRENLQLLTPELFTFTNLAAREGLVTNTYVVGESLHEPYMLGLRDNFIGQPKPLAHEFADVSGMDLHATATVALFIMKPGFRLLSQQLKRGDTSQIITC